MKKPNIGILAFVALAVIDCLSYTGNLKAQEAAVKTFKVGDRVEMNVANDVLNEDRWVKGTVTETIYADGGRLYSYKVKQDGSYDLQVRNLARLIRPLNDGRVEMPARTEKEVRGVHTNEVNSAPTNTNAACSFEKYAKVNSTMKFSEELVKSVLYERYSFDADTGSLTSPGAIGVKFLNIQIGKPYTNTVTVVPGRGAERKQDGAPPNTTIYPYNAKYIVCKKYSKEITQTQYESNFVCFKDNGGNWSCPVDGVPKITYPK